VRETQRTPGSRHWQRQPWLVYRFYGEGRALLYVGVTSDWAVRYGQHKLAARWFSLAREVELEHFSRRDDAYAREADIIRDDGPRYNRRRPTGDAPVWPREGAKRRLDITLSPELADWLAAGASARNVSVPEYMRSLLDQLRECEEEALDTGFSRSIARAPRRT
jgi:predicted GIY-YIG superfamily endonuclease